MFTYRPRGNKIYHYSICEFKGMNVETARKEYIKTRNKLGRMYVNLFDEVDGSKYCLKFKDIMTSEDKDILLNLLGRHGEGITKKQETYFLENCTKNHVINTKSNFKKRKITLRLEEVFLYTLALTENTDNFTTAIREAIAKYISDNNLIGILEKTHKLLNSSEINSIDEFKELYK
jgi:hypothetical protein